MAFQSRNAMIDFGIDVLNDTSMLTEMMSVMYVQAEEIRKERPVTAENMSNIVVNYLAQTGLDEKTQKIVKKLFLQVFKGTE